LAHVRERIERKLEFGNDLHTRPEGLHRARNLLEQLSPGVQRGIADALAVQCPALASELHRNIFRFNDLTRLHRHDVEKIVRLVAGDRLAVALKYAENRVREYALAALPAATAKTVRESLDKLDELSMQQSTDAQQQIVDVINELFRKRVIARPRTETTMRAA
jgi:flagellar motor switch protein FliG